MPIPLPYHPSADAMDQSIEKTQPPADAAPERVETGFDLIIKDARLDAHEVRFGDLITLEEVRLTGTGIGIRTQPESALSVAELNGTLVVTESALNRLLAGRALDSLRDLEVAMLNGRVRISGKYTMLLGLGVPFTLTAVPEIEGGARLRLDPRQISVMGPALPGFVAEIIGEHANAALAKAFDSTRLPLPVRLTGLTVETGRLLLTATASLHLHPSALQPPPRG